MAAATPLPDFTRWINPVLRALIELGGSARPREVVDRVAKNEAVSDQVLDELMPSGGQRFNNQVHWARFYLAHQGYIDKSRQGVWTLTEKGRLAHPMDGAALANLYEQVQLASRKTPSVNQVETESTAATPTTTTDSSIEEGQALSSALPPDAEDEDYRNRLLQLLQKLSPSGFERICQRLLREAGFEQVVVTGKSGDGGIDGHGVLSLNSFVSFRVLFQCKRYSESVSPSQVRDFRGAMQGRADKGLILTTGNFTVEARREATRDGAPPIELVDGEKLVELFAKYELGLRPVPNYEVVDSFFDEYR